MIRLLVVAPNEMIASLISDVLEREDDFKVVDTCTTTDEVFGSAWNVDLVALHVSDRNGNLAEMIRALRTELPTAKIVLVNTPCFSSFLLEALELGVSSYVRQDQTTAEMLEVMRTVHARGAVIDPELGSVMVRRLAELHKQLLDTRPLIHGPSADLTERECEVLELVSQGLTNAEIAEKLYISVGTVKNHIHNILTKLETDNREQAGTWYRWQTNPELQSSAELIEPNARSTDVKPSR